MKATILAVDIRRAAMDLLACREHSQQELQLKLSRKFSRKLMTRSVHQENIPINDDLGADSVCMDVFADAIQSLKDMIEQQLVRLAEENLQSDERFVESFVNSRKSRGDGPQKIRCALQQKCVSVHLLEQFVDEADEQWQDLARQVYFKKFGEGLPQDYRDKAKRLRFMQQRGFSLSMITPLFVKE